MVLGEVVWEVVCVVVKVRVTLVVAVVVAVVDGVVVADTVAVDVTVVVELVVGVVVAVEVRVLVTLVVGVDIAQFSNVPSTNELMAKFNSTAVALHRATLSLRNPPTEQLMEVFCGSAGLVYAAKTVFSTMPPDSAVHSSPPCSS